jgi:hypothetical protein
VLQSYERRGGEIAQSHATRPSGWTVLIILAIMWARVLDAFVTSRLAAGKRLNLTLESRDG